VVKRTIRWTVGAALVIVAAIALRWVLQDRDAARIRRQFDRLVADTEKRGRESLLDASTRARSIAAAFIDTPRLALPPVADGERSRAELVGIVFQTRALLDSLAVRIHSRQLEFSPDRRRAVLHVTAEISGIGGGYIERGLRSARIEWVRTDEGWRIAAAEAETPLRPLPPP